MLLIRYVFIAGLLIAQSASAQFVIRTYQVPVEHQEAIEAVLGEAVSVALGFEERRRGVSSPGPGQLVVTAPAEIQADIEQFLQDFQPTEIANLRTEYWIVRGEPGASASSPPELEPISEVLESINTAAGEMSYSVEAEVEILARANGSGATAQIPGRGHVFQELEYIGGKVIGTFTLNFDGNELATEIAITPSDFIVLGRTGLIDADSTVPPSQRFVILRSRLVE